MVGRRTSNAIRKDPFRTKHAALLRSSLKRCTGLDIVTPDLDARSAAAAIFYAPWALLSHNADHDPRFTYANRTGLRLFGIPPDELAQHHSSETTLPEDRPERERLLARVRHCGFVNDYSGVRVSTTGVRFMVKNAVVWNMLDAQGRYTGQAAMFRCWRYLI